ncbi:armadillo-type protein [Naematelia encephala]|uniref:Exportin-T n=1 Tax=Naematelia encephala TaxID=71784 RepID=A0A1Y2BIY0_9TREE|nr:armadillo-type protein [Naematelia encephala]
MAAQSPHLAQIPQAVRIAASVDPSIDAALKSQAVDYLTKVKELCEETWQDCLSLYLQGAGAPGPSQIGKDGKEKLDTELRMFCEQVVETVLIHKPEVMNADNQRVMYQALVDFVKTEWVDGPGEGGQSFLRNKLAFTLTHLFINVYPASIPTFLHPFLQLLAPPDPSSSSTSFHPPLLAIRMLSEIAMEIHDSTIRSSRSWAKETHQRDGLIRDAIRTSGDERMAVEGMLALAEKGLTVVESGQGDRGKWLELAEMSMKTLATWTPWTDLAVSLTQQTLPFYHRLLRQPITSLRISSAAVIRTFVAKGIKDPSERLSVLKAVGVIDMLDPLEISTRDASKDDSEMTAFRAALGSILQQYGSGLLAEMEDEEWPEPLKQEADGMMTAALPLLLRFLSDRRPEVVIAAGPFVSDLLRTWKKLYVPKPGPTIPNNKTMPPPPLPTPPLPTERRAFLSSLLDISVRQLAWPEDAEWEAPGTEDPDPDDDLALLMHMRSSCRTFIESISAIDKGLHTEVVANIVVSTLETLSRQGSSAVPWQQAELALNLVYTFGEMNKNNTRAAFFELPPEVASLKIRAKMRRASINKLDAEMASGRTTPSSMNGDSESVDPASEKIDYEQYPLTPLGQLLTLCQSSGIISYPHPSVTLQYFEIVVRYAEFWKSKPRTLKPVLEAMLGQRGIHHSDAHVRRRCFYLFSRFVSTVRSELELDVIPPIIDSMKDILVINAELPDPDTPEDDLLIKATTGKNYLTDQLHLFEAAGNLVFMTKSDPQQQLSLLEAIAGGLMSGIGSGVQAYRANRQNLQAVLQVHHYLLALGNFAKGFPQHVQKMELLGYEGPFKQMTEALLEALGIMKTQRIVRDSARFAFSQFVNAIGTSVAELVPQFVSAVVTEFEPSELVDFMTFLNLLMHRLKTNTFETMDMLLLPLLSRIFAVLQSPITGTDEANTHRRLKDTYLQFFTALMNANLDGVFISDRNKSEFENVLSALLNVANDCSDTNSQRVAFSFFAKSVIAWGTSPEAAAAPSVFAESAMSTLSKAVANGKASATNQHTIPREQRAKQALPGYENFIYQRLVPACFEVPGSSKFNTRAGTPVLFEIAMLLRNTLSARGQEAINFLLNDLLPKLQCPPEIANQLVERLRTQQAKDFRQTFAEFIKAMKA